MQTIYEWDFRGSDPQVILKRNLKQFEKSFEDTSFVQDLVDGVIGNLAKIDGVIGPVAPEWPIEQIAVMDRTILRLAVYELLLKREVPPKVVINEAVELAKAFGGENSSKFVNGVLGTVYRASDLYDPAEDKKMQTETEEQPAAEPPAEFEKTVERAKKLGPDAK